MVLVVVSVLEGEKSVLLQEEGVMNSYYRCLQLGTFRAA